MATAQAPCDILIIDDDPVTRESLGDLLEAVGYRVRSAADGLDALGYLRRDGLPRLILCDLMMPRMNGWVFRLEQQHDPELSGIPTVMVSGKEDPEPAASYLAANDHLAKPLDPERLFTIIRRYCDQQAGSRQAA
jgi:two-component system, chemotaxis family, chemotaxis protein CheY